MIIMFLKGFFMEKKKGFWAEFKEFISRGSVMDMAVGIIVGTAFTAIVNSLVNDILMPFIGYIIGGVSFESFKLTLPSITGGDPAVIAYGTFIQTVINFLIIALVIFLLIKGINKLHRTEEPPEEPEEETEPSEELKTLTEIRDLLKAQADTTAHADKADAEAEKSGKDQK